MTPLSRVQTFLNQKRFAIVGVSREPKDFSRSLFRAFVQQGYDPVPVHPEVREMEGRPCFGSLAEIQPPVEGVLFMTNPAATAKIAPECVASGIKRVWMYRATGTGAATADTVQFCEANGMEVVPGECPFMFLPGGAWFHRLHGFVRKITGAYPK
jgi:predicted CoA-binding protein